MKAQTRLYLASTSPRRRLLIQALGLPVTIGSSPIDEGSLQAAYSGPGDELGEYLARCKAASAARVLAEAPGNGSNPQENVFVVGADTTVLLDGRVLGKPTDPQEAADMLRNLRGRQHIVVTGVALAKPVTLGEPDDLHSTSIATRVTMRTYSEEEIAAYVATGDPMDKAGAYAVQHGDFRPVSRIVGCYTAVVGLPLCALAALVADLTGMAPQPRSAHPGYPDAAPQTHTILPDTTSGCPWSDHCRAPLPTCVPPQAR